MIDRSNETYPGNRSTQLRFSFRSSPILPFSLPFFARSLLSSSLFDFLRAFNAESIRRSSRIAHRSRRTATADFRASKGNAGRYEWREDKPGSLFARSSGLCVRLRIAQPPAAICTGQIDSSNRSNRVSHLSERSVLATRVTLRSAAGCVHREDTTVRVSHRSNRFPGFPFVSSFVRVP